MQDEEAAGHQGRQPGSPTLSRAFLAGRPDSDLDPAIELVAKSYFGEEAEMARQREAPPTLSIHLIEFLKFYSEDQAEFDEQFQQALIKKQDGTRRVKNKIHLQVRVLRERLNYVIAPGSPALAGQSYQSINQELIDVREHLQRLTRALRHLSEPAQTVLLNAMFPVYHPADQESSAIMLPDDYDYLSLLVDVLERKRRGLDGQPPVEIASDEDYRAVYEHFNATKRALLRPELTLLVLKSGIRACIDHINYALDVTKVPAHRPQNQDLHDFVYGLAKIWMTEKGQALSAGRKPGTFGHFCLSCLWVALPAGDCGQEIEKKLQNVVKSVVRSVRAAAEAGEKPA